MEVIRSQPSSLLKVTDDISSLLEEYEFANIHPISLLPKEMSKNMDKLMADEDPDVTEAKKFFMSLFDEDSVKLNTSLILLLVKAAGFQVIPKEIEREGVKVMTSNHQLLCESEQNYILGQVFHAAMLNVKEYTPSSLLCNKVATLIGDHFFSTSTQRGAETRFCRIYDLAAQAFTQSIEGQFVELKDVDSWIQRYSLEHAMDGSSLEGAVILGDDKKKEEAEAAYDFGINFALIRCIKKELQEFQQNKKNNNILQDSLPVLHAFAGRENQIETTVNLLEEVVKMKGVEKTMMQMKDLQEKALKNLEFFTSDSEAHEALKNLVIAYVDADIGSLEKEKGNIHLLDVVRVFNVSFLTTLLDSSTQSLVNCYLNLKAALSEKSWTEVKAFFFESIGAQGSMKKRMEKMLDYTMTGAAQIWAGGFTQCIITLPSVTPELRHSAEIMGWLVGMLTMVFCFVDDIVDKSPTRYGKPCYYTLPGVGKTAALDANLILSWIPLAVHHFFRHHECYQEITVEMSKYIVTLTKGQLQDSQNVYKTGTDDIDIEKFTMDRWKENVSLKNNSSSLISVCLYLCGERKKSLHEEAQRMGSDGSLFLQYNNDFYDAYPGPGSSMGTDIPEGRVTWLICRALEMASPEQKKILEQNYGKKDKKCIKAVKKVYRELNLKEELKKLESFHDEEKWIEGFVQETKGTKTWGEEGISRRFIEDTKRTVKEGSKHFHFFNTFITM